MSRRYRPVRAERTARGPQAVSAAVPEATAEHPLLPSAARPAQAPGPGTPGAGTDAARPSPADLHNPYGRYYTRPRSFEELVAQRRAEPKPLK